MGYGTTSEGAYDLVSGLGFKLVFRHQGLGVRVEGLGFRG